jgi:general stress protein 26
MDGDKRRDALTFLKSHKTGVLSTLSPEGHPRARTIYYSCDDAFNIFFITLTDTRKVKDITAHEQVAFVVSAEDVPQTLQLEGTAEDQTEVAVLDENIAEITKHWLSNTAYRAPLTHFDPGIIRYYRITPTWVRWGDFRTGEGTSEVLTIIHP